MTFLKFGVLSPATIPAQPTALRKPSWMLAVFWRLPCFWPVRSFPHYIVVYDPATEPLQIIRLLHGRRSLPHLLR
jgi:hypothetical protein